MKLSPTDQENLWISAEHWLETYHDPANAKIDRASCKCCQAAEGPNATPSCNGCPIFLYTGKVDCLDTPYGDAKEEHYYRVRNNYVRFQAAAAKEYTFLVSLALGENPSGGKQ